MKHWLHLWLGLCAPLLFACGDAPNGNAPPSGQRGALQQDPPDKPKGTIGLSVLTMRNPFFKDIAEAVTDEAGKHGYEVLVVSGDRDVQKQANQVDDFIVRRVAAIILNPCDQRSTGAAIQKANAAGIPVFTCDLACVDPNAEVVSHIATDNYQGGKLAGEAMIEALEGKGGDVVVVHFKQAESCQLRVKGFREVIDRHNANNPGSMIDVVAELPGGGMRDEGFKATEDALTAHPELVGIFAINDPSALGARAALEKNGKQDRVQIIAFDGQRSGKLAIKEGKLYAEPVQFPRQIGRLTVRSIVAYFAGESVPDEQLIPTELYRRDDAESDPELR